MKQKERFTGLSSAEAKKLLEKFGTNEIKETSKISWIKILFRQIRSNFVVYLLFVAVLISFFVGKDITGYTIIGVIFVVVSAGFIQEYRAERAVLALKQMLMPVSILIRDRKEQEISSKEIVPGDILILRNGERIPADCIIIQDKELLVDESILTGESRELKKIAAKDFKDYNEENMLFMGSFIVNGKCLAKVIHTGMDTRFGKIAGLISSTKKELPLQKKVNKIAKYMALIAISISFITGILMLFSAPSMDYESITTILILIIALSVSAFPEGFPVVLISTLSLGAYKMAKKNAIVNRMSIIETLGETTIICADKTGTITKGEMTVKKIFADNRVYDVLGTGYEAKGDFFFEDKKINLKKEDVLNLMFKTSVLCNDAIIKRTGEDNIYSVIGAPTEASLLIMSAKAGIFKEDLDYFIEEEIPFSSERKIMSVFVKENDAKRVYSKGALETVLNKCKYIQRERRIFRMLERDRKKILEINKRFASNAFRTLAFAYKKASSLKCSEKKCFEQDLVFLGIVAIEDPPREEIKGALIMCKNAGIKVKMITGDHKETAVSIAKQIGLDSKEFLEGNDIDRLSDEELSKIVQRISIFARVRPEHKLRIVKALKKNGEIVIMTGDGVNDAPALKEAHIGVAMGKNGTDVSRSVADLTLKDDNFATIVVAIREGRTIFNNIRKFVSYQLSCNYSELMILFVGVLLAPFFGWPIPLLLAIQILFMNIVTDNIPAITLGFNPSSNDLMIEKPRKKVELLNKNLFFLVLFAGSLMALFTLGVFYTAFNVFNQSPEDARTTALVALIVIEIAGAFNFRSFRKGVLDRSLFVNKYLVYASLISISATIIIIYTPFRKIFETIPIPFFDWIVAFGAAFILVVIFDILKNINEKRKFWSAE